MCLNDVSWTEGIRYPKQTVDYRSSGRSRRRKPGRSLKRLLDGYNREIETGRYWPEEGFLFTFNAQKYVYHVILCSLIPLLRQFILSFLQSICYPLRLHPLHVYGLPLPLTFRQPLSRYPSYECSILCHSIPQHATTILYLVHVQIITHFFAQIMRT